MQADSKRFVLSQIGIAVMILTGAIYICDIVIRIGTLQVLELGWNNVGDEGAVALAGALRTSKISVLDICKCSITLLELNHLDQLYNIIIQLERC